LQKNDPRRSLRKDDSRNKGPPCQSEDFEEVSEEDEDESEGSEEDSFDQDPRTQSKRKGHQRLSSKQFEENEASEYNSDLDQTMQQKYKE